MDPELRERLLHRAFLYDDPSAFTAGVDAAMEEFARLMASQAAAQTVGAMPTAETAAVETSRGPVSRRAIGPAGPGRRGRSR